ncbi:MAG: hybrid sensor histidine kinase/response regulator [Nitrospiraceae bacterium]|nr:MAG: hybrid sensor histidine kinase/response regulator [Nitrospiraceae bacterium]
MEKMDKEMINVLMIEDNPGDARLIREMLAETGFSSVALTHSQTFSNGLDFLRNNPCDVTLLDFGLPDSSGLDSIEAIRKHIPAIPIVVLTGLDDEETAISTLHLGAQDYLVKGKIDGDLLARSLRYAIERKNIEGELQRHREFLMELVEERTGELQKSNEDLQAANELLVKVFSNVHVLIAYMDTEFNFIRVNNKYAEADGRAPEFFVGKNHFELYPDEENEAIFKKVVETGEPFFVRAKPFVYPGHTDRGTSFWDWSLKPVKDVEGRITGLVLSLIEVTENIMLYSELMRSEHLASIGRLAAGVAHEVNNPINGIINYAQMLLKLCADKSKEHDIACRIIREGDRIAGIVRSLLSFARGDRAEKKCVHISEILSDSLALTETQVRKDGIKLGIDMPPDLPMIFANPQQIEQVFLNLISNACYALNRQFSGMHDDKILSISAEQVTVNGSQWVQIIFHDRGTGIPEEIRDKIMDPFFTTKPGSDGTGLGLSISHGIISDHKGFLKIETVRGAYTKAIINLPIHGDPSSKI